MGVEVTSPASCKPCEPCSFTWLPQTSPTPSPFPPSSSCSARMPAGFAPGRHMLSHSVTPDSLRPHGLQPTRLLCPWDSPGKNTEVGLPCPPPRGLPDPGIKLRSPELQADSLPSEPPGEPCLSNKYQNEAELKPTVRLTWPASCSLGQVTLPLEVSSFITQWRKIV